MLNALTIDVEDYYQVSAFESSVRFEDWGRYESRVEHNTNRILDLLDEHKSRGTFFILGWIAEREPKLVRSISERGHEMASHGYSHRRVNTQTPRQFREETGRSKKVIEDAIGQRIIGYRAASYSIVRESLWALEILAEEGFCYDSSIFPIRHDRYGIPGYRRFSHPLDLNGTSPMIEIPLSTVEIAGFRIPAAGGGYLRLLPYAYTRWAMNRLNQKEKRPAIVYLHPWELDPVQPRIPSGWKSRFRHYTNLEGMETKLNHLLADFSFAPIKTVFETMLNPLLHETVK
ncbi:MAG: XrtA system polysaccharide deacetylase [Nitrospiria bacterium]